MTRAIAMDDPFCRLPIRAEGFASGDINALRIQVVAVLRGAAEGQRISAWWRFSLHFGAASASSIGIAGNMKREIERPPVIALINSTPDIVEVLRVAFEHAGFVVVSTFTHLIRSGDVDLESFMEQHQPQAIVYDIAPPYASNWNLFRHLSQLPALKDRPFVVTSTNPARLRELAEVADQTICEIVETPYLLSQLIEKVREAIARNG